MNRIEKGRPDGGVLHDDAIQIIGLVMAGLVGDAKDRLRIFDARYGRDGSPWLAAYLHHVIACTPVTDWNVEDLLAGGVLPTLDLSTIAVRKAVAAAQEVRELLGAGDVDGFVASWTLIDDAGLIALTRWALLGAAAAAVGMSLLDASIGLPPCVAFPESIYTHSGPPA